MRSDSSLRVYYPGGGKLLLLHWWTYDERGHVVLAPTERDLQAIAKRVFDEHTDAEIRAYCEIDVVAPSARLCALAVAHTLRENIESFHLEVLLPMREALSEGKELPAPFARCASYEPYEPEENPSPEHEEWLRSTHYGCRNCRETVQLVGMTPAELYARYHAAWRETHPVREHNDRKRVVSRAPAALDDEPLWAACADFGHHASGIVLGAIDLDEDPSCTINGQPSSSRPAALSDRVLFFFRRGVDRDPGIFQAMLDQAKVAAEKRQTDWSDEQGAERERETRERIDGTIAFFATRSGPA